ncbi:hypothetical protein [Rheinheimera soli]|uniref:Uncharacterized protein n=1 Tax=Rheinheimera soli TaxID=443616 RepID=A0ABU1VUP9_9GAMM|nr:hypothetical protein [Rheinheimera soli]MDR7119295.1 hypothetical protein [Rheinheimera soli]
MTKKFNQLIWLGAGNGTEPKGLIELAETSLLVEAREDAFKNLVNTFLNSKTVSLKQSVISTHGGEVSFHQYNLPEFSALCKATGLIRLFPGLRLANLDTVVSEGIVDLLTEAKVTGKDNLFVIDIPDISLSLLQQLDEHQFLNRFCQILLVGSSEALFLGASNSAELINFMLNHGFYLAAEDKTDPDLPWLTFVSNPLWQKLKQAQQQETELNKQLDIQHKKLVEQHQQAEQLKKELSLVTESNKNLYEQMSTATVVGEKKQAELKDCLEQLDTANKKLVSLSENAKRQENDFILLQKRAELLEKQLERANEDNSLFRSQQLANSSLFELERSIKELFAQQMLQVQHVANALGQHVTKTQVEQQNSLRSFLGLQQFLQHGERQLDIGEWSIQADTLNCLIKLLERNSYDLVIEFGSGDSTLVIAKTLMNQSSSLHDIAENGRLELAKISNLEQTQPVHYAHDLPARVISFEQSKEYLNKTKQALNEHGVAGFVELILAPLVPVEPSCNYDSGQTHLFYDCITKLKKLADILSERQSNILVIVDGPQSPEQDAFVRYAALPSIINVFSAHKLHIVLDDSKRDGEQQVITKWLDLLEQRGLFYTVNHWPTVKGAALIEVTP